MVDTRFFPFAYYVPLRTYVFRYGAKHLADQRERLDYREFGSNFFSIRIHADDIKEVNLDLTPS